MNVDRLRRYCLSLPHVTEHMQWGDNLVFKVAGKIVAIASIDVGSAVVLSFKADPESFAMLVERDGAIPAPYLARNHWVALERWNALTDAEIEQAVSASWALVAAGLPKRTRLSLGLMPDAGPPTPRSARRARTAPSPSPRRRDSRAARASGSRRRR